MIGASRLRAMSSTSSRTSRRRMSMSKRCRRSSARRDSRFVFTLATIRRHTRFMATNQVTARDHERFARARAQGLARSQDPSAVVEARYEPGDHALRLTFRSGGGMLIPIRMVSELADQPATALAKIDVSPAGDALSWRSLDVDIFVPELVEDVFGARLFAAATGRRGGRRRTKVKAAAARLNGAKGGRPRKRATA